MKPLKWQKKKESRAWIKGSGFGLSGRSDPLLLQPRRSDDMPRGLPRGTDRRGIQGGMPPWSQGAGFFPAREGEAASGSERWKGEVSSPSKLTVPLDYFIQNCYFFAKSVQGEEANGVPQVSFQ